MPSATPLRAHGVVDEDGLRVLSEPAVRYADGAESRLAEIVAGATDISSSSQELAAQATDWPTAYSLIPSRANLLRALDIGPEMSVLEIGCGCGPLTRYLGERAGLVDSLEPMAARARVARLRTRDLPNVEVCRGTLEDVPRRAAYDLVVVVGVLEYVGNGSSAPEPYLEFLARCRDVLKDDGLLVVAIENALGTKYLAGGAEDHTGRPFDSLEGYVLPTPARTFSRARLAELVRAVGLTPTVLGAFPDYKVPRVVVADGLFDQAPELAARLPRFPSPDWVVPRLPVADEGLLWRELVGTGHGMDFANSFVVLAGRDEAQAHRLWPEDRLAVVLSTERQPRFAVRAEVRSRHGEVAVDRTRAYPEVAVAAAADEKIRHAPPQREPVVVGDDLLELVLRDPSRRKELLQAWATAVPEDEPWMPVDLVPHNAVVGADGAVRFVDQEWQVAGYPRESVLVRGLLWSAVRLAQLGRPAPEDPDVTVRELMEDLATDVGLELSADVVARFVAHEAEFQAAVNATDATEADRRSRSAADLLVILGQTLREVRGGDRLDARWSALQARAAEAEARAAAQERELVGFRRMVERRERRPHVRAYRFARRTAGRVLRRLGLR